MLYFIPVVLLLSISYYAAGSHKDSNSVTAVNSSHTNCPTTWFIYDNATSRCECGSLLGGIISCSDEENFRENSVFGSHCMTYDKELGVVAGLCFYNDIKHQNNSRVIPQLYLQLPLNDSLLDDKMCGVFRRTGRLCGSCQEGLQLSAYSYDMKCVKCSTSVLQNWIKYLSVAFLPLTGFFVFVLVFRISVTSPKWNGYLLLAQYLASPSSVRVMLSALEANPIFLYWTKCAMTLYGVWNLDFFRTLYPPICLNMSTLPVLALDYVVAVYPLVLVFLAYACIQLHARGCKLLVFLWFPFRKYYARIQRKVDIKASIIDVFSSFLALSYVKFLVLTFNLLTPVKVYNVRGESLGYYVFFDANLKYFGSEHLPYAILALVVAFFLSLPLLLLLIYPLRTFQRFCGNWQALRIFIDSFQGCYKDGVVEGKYDCRYFSAIFLILRIAILSTYSLTLSGYFYPLSLIILMAFALILVIVKPYKEKYSAYLTIDIMFLLMATMWNASITAWTYVDVKVQKSLFIAILCGLLGTLPFVYMPMLVLKELRSKLSLREKVNCVFLFGRKRNSLRADYGEDEHLLPKFNEEDNYVSLK